MLPLQNIEVVVFYASKDCRFKLLNTEVAPPSKRRGYFRARLLPLQNIEVVRLLGTVRRFKLRNTEVVVLDCSPFKTSRLSYSMPPCCRVKLWNTEVVMLCVLPRKLNEILFCFAFLLHSLFGKEHDDWMEDQEQLRVLCGDWTRPTHRLRSSPAPLPCPLETRWCRRLSLSCSTNIAETKRFLHACPKTACPCMKECKRCSVATLRVALRCCSVHALLSLEIKQARCALRA